MNRPLEGVKVVDLTSYLAGPQCGRALHEMQDMPKDLMVRVAGYA